MIGNGRSEGSKGPGHRIINKYGENQDIDTASVPETIWSHGGIFPFLDTAIEMDFNSTLASDDIAGTGAQKIEITFYDNSHNEFIQVFDTDGTADVQLPGTIKLVSRIEVVQSGTGGVNEGDIHIVDRSTGIIVYQSLKPNNGQTLTAVQMIPSGKKGKIQKATVNYAKLTNKNDAALTLRIRRANGSTIIKHRSTISSASPKNGIEYDLGGIEVFEGDIVYWQCDEVSANDTGIYATFDIEWENV